MYGAVRDLTEELTKRLSGEDQTAQSLPDASPTKWHRAHTTWFFETFVLGPNAQSYSAFDPSFAFLFNSYYEAAGPRHARPQRGVITRPGIERIANYRRHVDVAMTDLVANNLNERVGDLVTLGLHHEQQHHELMVMDIVDLFSRNPTFPSFGALPWITPRSSRTGGWISHDGGNTARPCSSYLPELLPDLCAMGICRPAPLSLTQPGNHSVRELFRGVRTAEHDRG